MLWLWEFYWGGGVSQCSSILGWWYPAGSALGDVAVGFWGLAQGTPPLITSLGKKVGQSMANTGFFSERTW